MTPLDFLDFRDMLRPASGFQSMQFKVLEAKLGLRMEKRHGKQYYASQLKPHHKAEIEALEGEQTLLELVNGWLERMPFLEESTGPGRQAFFQPAGGTVRVQPGAGARKATRNCGRTSSLTGSADRALSAKASARSSSCFTDEAHLPTGLPVSWRRCWTSTRGWRPGAGGT